MAKSRIGRGAPTAPVVTYALTAAMLLVSVPTLVVPSLARVLGGIGPARHPWQPFSAAFEHGWPGFPLWLHLLGNLLLAWVVGVAAERMLGSARFLVLTLAAIGLFALASWLSGTEANGSSVFLYAYAPVVFVALRRCPAAHLPADADRWKGILFVMWVVIPIGMGAMAVGMGVSVLWALPVGNIFHITGTIAGMVAAWLWGRRAVGRLSSGAMGRSPADRAAGWLSLGIPLFLSAVVALALLGVIGPTAGAENVR